jgi:hypothetical protein
VLALNRKVRRKQGRRSVLFTSYRPIYLVDKSWKKSPKSTRKVPEKYQKSTRKMRDFPPYSDYIYDKGNMTKVI